MEAFIVPFKTSSTKLTLTYIIKGIKAGLTKKL